MGQQVHEYTTEHFISVNYQAMHSLQRILNTEQDSALQWGDTQYSGMLQITMHDVALKSGSVVQLRIGLVDFSASHPLYSPTAPHLLYRDTHAAPLPTIAWTPAAFIILIIVIILFHDERE